MTPTLVLLPGMDGTGELFEPFLAAVKEHFGAKIIRYPVDRFLDYAALTGWVESQLPTNERFVLVAESFSGPIPITVTAGKPTGLAGLVLCATLAQNPRPILGSLIPLLGLVPLGWVPARLMSYFFLGRFATTELRGVLSQAIRKVDPFVTAQRLRSITKVNVTHELQQIDVPLLYLTASKDSLVPPTAGRLFERPEKQWRVTKVTGPHLLLQGAPHEVLAVIKKFFDSL